MSNLSEALNKLRLIKEGAADETGDYDKHYVLPRDINSYSYQKEGNLTYKFISGDNHFTITLESDYRANYPLEIPPITTMRDSYTCEFSKEFCALWVDEINGVTEDFGLGLSGNCEYYISLIYDDFGVFSPHYSYNIDKVKRESCSFVIDKEVGIASPYHKDSLETIVDVLNNEIKKGDTSEFYKDLFQIVTSFTDKQVEDADIDIDDDGFADMW